MPNPNQVAQATTHNWIGSQAAFNILKPTIDSKEYKSFGEEDITGLMEVMGSKNAVKSVGYRHFEDDRLHETIQVTGTSTGADGAVVYTLVSASTFTGFPAEFEPYLLASAGDNSPNASGTTTLNPVRLNETIMFPDGITRGTVTALPSTTTFTVTPDLEGGSLPTLAGTEELVLLGVSVGEGADTPDGVNLRQATFTNVLQIMGDSAKATGTSMGEQTWVEFTGKDGRKKPMWFYKQQKDTYKRFKNGRELALVFGQPVTSTTTLALTHATLLKTEGLYTFAESYNGSTDYSIATGLSLADFDTLIIDSLDANEGAMENAIMASITLRSAIDGFVRQEMKSGAVQYNSFGGGKEQSVNFGFDSFIHLGYTFHLKTYKVLNNPKLMGAITKYKNSGLVLPMDKRAYSMEGGSKETIGSFRMNYMEIDNFSASNISSINGVERLGEYIIGFCLESVAVGLAFEYDNINTNFLFATLP